MKIDITKLSRDFKKEPITSKNGPTREDLVYLFSTGAPVEEMRKALNTSTYSLYKWADRLDVERDRRSDISDIEDKIDFTRLTRDYRKEPLRYMEAPPKADLDYLYNEALLRRDEVTRVFGRGKSEGFCSKWLVKYGIKLRDKSVGYQRAKETYRKKTGYDHPTQNPEYVAWFEKKHGAKYALLTESARERMLKVINTPDMIARAKKTRRENNLCKYGVESSSQIHIPKESLDILNDKEALEQLYATKSLNEVASLLGVTDTCIRNYIKRHGIQVRYALRASKGQHEIEELIDWVKFRTDRSVIHPYEIDLFDCERKIGIEFNGNYWHSAVRQDSLYHQRKSIMAERNGAFIYHVYEYEWEDPVLRDFNINQLNYLFGKYTTHVSADSCIVKNVDSTIATTFLKTNYMPGPDRSGTYYGLYSGADLVYVMEVYPISGDIRGADWCLGRTCVKVGLVVDGADKKLFSYFLSDKNPVLVVKYQDFAKSNGSMEKSLGFKFDRLKKPCYVWAKDHRIIYRHEANKRTLMTKHIMPRTEKRSVEKYLSSIKYYKLHDCGQKIWYYKNK